MDQVLDTQQDPRPDVYFVSQGALPTVWARHKSIVSLTLSSRDTSLATPDTLFRVDLFPGGKGAAQVDPIRMDTLPGTYNYYRPDIMPGITDVTATSRVIYEGIYDQIDWHLYGGRSGPKMALVCWPGSDPSDIIMHFTGVDSLHVDLIGDLKLFLSGRWLSLREAEAYQVDSTGNVVPLAWDAEYVEVAGMHAITFSFDVYDQNLPLVLQIGEQAGAAWTPPDPRNLTWSTYAGSNDADEFMAADVDGQGDVYVCGYAYLQNFPVATGFQEFASFDAWMAGSEDAVVMKFKASNKQISWSTYLGGSASGTGTLQWMGLDKAYDIAVFKGDADDFRYAIVTGSTVSTDFTPVANSTSIFANADQTSNSNNLGRHMAWIAAYTQLDGKLHWCTTHGAPDGDSWVTDGLAVDMYQDGTIAWGGRISENPSDPLLWDYPHVTPSSAFTKAIGGGFLTLFDADYQVEWRTPFGSRGLYVGLSDLKIDRIGTAQHRVAFATGTTLCDLSSATWPLDVYQPPGSSGFHQPSPGGGITDAYVAAFDLDTYQLEYCTYWGGNDVERGVALEVTRSSPHNYANVWVGGLTKSTDLSTTELPAPTFPGGLHEVNNAGDADGFILQFLTTPDMDLLYGSLYGGPGPDAILDIEGAGECAGVSSTCKLFITGETASNSGIVQPVSGMLYQQDWLGNVPVNDRRDAFILALGQLDKAPIWTTYFGGMNADKGWGVAASPTELYLVGGCISDQLTFPLKEFDTGSPLDWYDGDILNNVGSSYGYYSFNINYYNNPFHGGPLQLDLWPGHSHDAFIASFEISTNLSVETVRPREGGLIARQLNSEGLWQLDLPSHGSWGLRVFDALGRLVQESAPGTAADRMTVDLSRETSGLYVVAVLDAGGRAYTGKLYRP